MWKRDEKHHNDCRDRSDSHDTAGPRARPAPSPSVARSPSGNHGLELSAQGGPIITLGEVITVADVR